jgi:hypothetical protein
VPSANTTCDLDPFLVETILPGLAGFRLVPATSKRAGRTHQQKKNGRPLQGVPFYKMEPLWGVRLFLLLQKLRQPATLQNELHKPAAPPFFFVCSEQALPHKGL